MRQLELERGLKTRSHGLLIAKPDSARLIWPGPREAQDVARNRGMTYKAEPLDGREIVEADRGRCLIDVNRD